MMIYEDFSFEGLILSQVDRKHFIADTSMYNNSYYEDGLKYFGLNPLLKRAVPKKKKD